MAQKMTGALVFDERTDRYDIRFDLNSYYRRCRAALIHHGIGGAFLLRFHVLRLDERHTVEGNSGDACKIKSYPVNYSCIKGYGLMNWN